MIASLVLYLCTTAAMDDCQAMAPASWEDPDAPIECGIAARRLPAQLRAEGFHHFRVECEVTPPGE